MPNRAALLRAEIEAAHPGALFHERTETGIVLRRPGFLEHKYSTGPIHWKGPADLDWRDIDTDLEDHAGWAGHVRSARFDTLCAADGTRRFIPRRWLPDEYVEFGRLEWQRLTGAWATLPVGTLTRIGNHLQGDDLTNSRYRVGFFGTGSRTTLVVKRAAVARPIRWSVTLNGLTWQDGTLISDSDGQQVGFIRQPRLIDSTPGASWQPIPWSYADGYLTVSPSFDGLTLPVTVDPDYSIAAGTDDCNRHPTYFTRTGTVLNIGHDGTDAYSCAFRFASIVAASAQTITTMTVALVSAQVFSTGTVYSDWYGVDQANDTAAPSDNTEWAADHAIHTTATVADDFASFWSGTHTTPELKTIGQEIIDLGTWVTGNAFSLHWDEGGSAAGVFQQIASYENTTYTEPVLSLTTAPSGTSLSVFEAHDWGTRRDETAGPTTLLTCSGLTSGKKYLVLYRGLLGASVTNNNANYLRATTPNGSTPYMARIEPNNVSYGNTFCWAWVGTSTGTSPSIQIYNNDAGTTYAWDLSILAIELDNLTEGTDYWTTADANYGGHTAGTWNTTVSQTLTPAVGDDLLIIGFYETLCDTVSYQNEHRITKDGSVLGGPSSIEGHDTVETYGFLLMAVDINVTATSRTYAVECQDETSSATPNDTDESLIFVLRLDRFESHLVATGSNTAPTAAAWNDVVAGGTYAPTTAGDQVVLGFCHSDIAAAANTHGARLWFAGTTADPASPTVYGVGKDATDIWPEVVFTLRSITSETVTLRGYPSANTIDFLNGVLVAFSKRLTAAAAVVKKDHNLLHVGA